MSLRCRIGWHNWVYSKPFRYSVQYVDEFDKPTYSEEYEAQKKTCTRCGRVEQVKV